MPLDNPRVPQGRLLPKLICTFLSFLAIGSATALGQETPRQITAHYIDSPIQLDGKLDELEWNMSTSSGNFRQFFPGDGLPAKTHTELRIMYSETTLYVGIRAYISGTDFVISSLRRDFRASNNDNVTLMFDTFQDGTNAFLFGVTPLGVQREALIANGGSRRDEFNLTWDMKWQAETSVEDDRYEIEIAIPFTSLKFPEGTDTWRFQSYRFDFQQNERSAWMPIPQNQIPINLAFMGELKFERPLGKSRTPLALIPYINTLAEQDFEDDASDVRLKVGGDAKVAIGNGMNLDVTLNPDFSNVEVDDIFTNLTRFEISLPEKRQFFIDNSDLFSSFGSFRDAIPFFSRRIGIARDTADNLVENQILGGVRLSGKLSQDWRLGFLNLQTNEDLPNAIPSNNNMMFALQKRVFSRSNIGVFWVNRESFKDYDFLAPEDRYNRVIGMDYNLASDNGIWNGKFYLHKSFQPGDSQGNLSSQAYLVYNTREYRIVSDWVYVDEDYQSDLGFIPRTDIFKNGTGINRTFWPGKGIVNSHEVGLVSIMFFRPGLDMKKTDHTLRFSYEAQFRNQANLALRYFNRFIFLTDPFDPTGTDGGVELPGDVGYHFNQVSAEFQSNQGRAFNFALEATAGRFFNGSSQNFGGELFLRLQPKAQLSLAFIYDRIRLPDPYPEADLWLVSPKVDITFSKSIFWSTLVQYSNQRDNLGINSRLQWRFAPLSDLYLVYNDNYFTERFAPRYRSINLKLTYWLNI